MPVASARAVFEHTSFFSGIFTNNTSGKKLMVLVLCIIVSLTLNNNKSSRVSILHHTY